MILAQLSDTHILDPASADPCAGQRLDNLRRCVADINRLKPRPDAVVHTGDLVHDPTPAAYALARGLLAELAPPLYVIPGNRDRREGLRAAFGADGYLPPDGAFLDYTVERHPVRLVALDTLVVGRGHGAIGADRLAWLEGALARAPDAPTVVLAHHPPFDTGHDLLAGYLRREDGRALAAAVGRHRQVLRVLCGHAHLAAEASVGEAVVSTMPSVAVDLRRDGGPRGPEVPPAYRLHLLADGAGPLAYTRFAAP